MQQIDRCSTATLNRALVVLTRVIAEVGRRARLSPEDAMDFGQTVHVRLLETAYRPLARYSGRSSLRTFLTVVVQRMLIDWRRTEHGKWRTSRVARRLGPAAVLLEQLVYRNGHTRSEAIDAARCRPDAPPLSELEALADLIPARLPRRHVPLESIDTPAIVAFDDPVERRERAGAARRLRQRLHDALRALPEEDQLLLDLRYRRQLRVPAIAEMLDHDCRALYRRCDRVLRSLRVSIESGE